MFKSTGGPKNPFNQRLYQQGQLLDVLSAETLLSGVHHQHWLTQLREVIDLPDEHYDVLVKDLIQSVAQFLQVLPEQMTEPLCGLMNKALVRSYYAAEHVKSTAPKDKRHILTYAAFSAGLLMNVSTVMVNYKIIMTSKKGAFQCVWNPLQGAMNDVGDYYVIRPIYNNVTKAVAENLTIMLARQLMPEIGFNWLASDAAVFTDWLHALLGDLDGAGIIGSGLIYFQTELTEEQLRLAELPIVDANPTDLAETAMGEAFLQWLQEAIKEGGLSVNTARSAVHFADQGIFIEVEKLFAEFAEQYGPGADYQSLLQQLDSMFGSEKYGQQGAFQEYVSTYGVMSRDPERSTTGQMAHGSGNVYANPLRDRAADIRHGFALGDSTVLLLDLGTSSVSSNLHARHTNQNQLPGLNNKGSLSNRKK